MPGVDRHPIPIRDRLRAALSLRITLDLSALYALTFGGFVAFGVYLPTYLGDVYGLQTADAAARAAGFIMLATGARPVGGWLADRLGGGRVLVVAFGVVTAAAAVQAFAPGIVVGTVGYAWLAPVCALGAAGLLGGLLLRRAGLRAGGAGRRSRSGRAAAGPPGCRWRRRSRRPARPGPAGACGWAARSASRSAP